MGLKRFVVKILAKKNEKSIHAISNNAIKHQLRLFKYLTSVLHKTEYGRGLGVPKNISISSFQKKIPIVNYEKIKPFINKVGEKCFMEGSSEILCKNIWYHKRNKIYTAFKRNVKNSN